MESALDDEIDLVCPNCGEPDDPDDPLGWDFVNGCCGSCGYIADE